MAQLYKEYTRSQIRSVLKPAYFSISVTLLAAMIIALVDGEFREIPNRGY
jgi:hypothetical protein